MLGEFETWLEEEENLASVWDTADFANGQGQFHGEVTVETTDDDLAALAVSIREEAEREGIILIGEPISAVLKDYRQKVSDEGTTYN